MIDIHTHILPGCDDGAASAFDALAMCDRALADGVHQVCATPHTQDGVYSVTAAQVLRNVDLLNRHLAGHGRELTIFPGSELHVSRDILSHLEQGRALTLNGSRYLLLELPALELLFDVVDLVRELRLKGLVPVIAHPERNLAIQHRPSILYRLVANGALAQVTAMSLTGGFGSRTQDTAERLVRHYLVHVIASDAHSAASRPPVLSPAVRHAASLLGNAQTAQAMATTTPEAILQDARIHPPEPVPFVKKKKRRFFGLF